MVATIWCQMVPQKAKQEEDKVRFSFRVVCGGNMMNAQMLEVSLFGTGMVLRLERVVWSMVTWLRQAAKEYASPLSPLVLMFYFATIVTLVLNTNASRTTWRALF